MDRELAAQSRLMRTYALVSAVALLVIGAVGWLVAGRLLRPLTLLRDAAQRVGETDLGARVPVTGNDDVSDLAERFNEMLARLETAFEAQRQFLDDAGHELRTPLTIVRGHLELLDPSDEDEVRETRALLLDEVDRMGRLVEDLMLLAKAERADFIRPDLVDLSRLTDDVFDKATALGDRDWQLEGLADVTIVGDEQRLTQAVLELARNAAKYTETGTTVAIGSRVAVRSPGPDEALVWVRDEGSGIDEGDVGRIFERFGRGASGVRAEGRARGWGSRSSRRSPRRTTDAWRCAAAIRA